MAIRVGTSGTTVVKRVTAAGTTVVKSISVGTPTKIGKPSTGLLRALDDVNVSNRQDTNIIRFDSATNTYVHSDFDSDGRSLISVNDLGGDGALAYDPSTGIIAYAGPSALEARAHFTGGVGLTYDSNSGTFDIDTTFTTFQYDSSTGQITLADITGNVSYLTADITQLLGKVKGSVVPSEDNIHSIGTDSNRFKFGNFNEYVNIGEIGFVYDSAANKLSLNVPKFHSFEIYDFDSGLTLAQFSSSNSASLHYGGVKRIATTDSGGNIFGNLNVSEDAVITGNLTVKGTTTTINSTDITINDKNIILADSAVSALEADGAGITVEGANATITYKYSTNTWDFNRPFGNNINLLQNYTTTQLIEGSNLYYLTSRADSDFDVRLATKTTADLVEGSNLYYTTARADSAAKNAIDVNDAGGDGSISYSPTTGIITYTGPSPTEVRAHFNVSGDITYDSATGKFTVDTYKDSDFAVSLSLRTTDNLTEGSNLYYTTLRADSDFDVRLTTKTTSDLTEGNNLYYTTARADSDARHAISGGDDISYDPNTGIISVDVDKIYTQQQFESDLGQTNTDILPEGNTNLYYTTARADSDARYSIQVVDNGGDGSLTYSTSTGIISYTGPSASEVRSHFSASGDITYDSATGRFFLDVEKSYTFDNFDSDFRTRLLTTTTDSVAEGSNLYYTEARADSAAKHAISVNDAGGDGSLTYSSDTGVITYTGPSASEVRAHFSAGTGVSLTGGVISIGQPVDSSDNVTFNTVTNAQGTITSTPTETLVDSDITFTIDSIEHGAVAQSIEYLIHLFDSTNGDTQITKMLATFSGSTIASNEFGTVFTGATDLGELDITLDGTNINLTFTRYATGSIDNVRTKVSKTILK